MQTYKGEKGKVCLCLNELVKKKLKKAKNFLQSPNMTFLLHECKIGLVVFFFVVALRYFKMRGA